MPTSFSLRRRAARWTAAAVGLSALAIGVSSAPATASQRLTALAPAHPLVVIGIAGVQWNQVTPSATPHLWSLLEHGSTATVTVRSVYPTTCPVDGWLTVNAGQRAADIRTPYAGQPAACRPLAEPTIALSRGAEAGP